MNETRLLMRSRFFYNVIRKVGDDFESKYFCCGTDLHSRFLGRVQRRYEQH